MTHLYPTSSTVAVFLNGIHIDQAYQLQFKEGATKVPIYGYNDPFFSKVAYGRVMVQGLLTLNFTFPGYLNTVLDESYEKQNTFIPRLYNYSYDRKQDNILTNNVEKELRTELPPNGTPEERAARAEYIASLISKKDTKEATKKALENLFTPAQVGSRIDSIDSPIVLLKENTIMDVYYQDPAYQTWFIRFENVHFNELSQSISQAGAEGSSDPLYEVYSFISSKKIIKLVTYEP